MNHHTCAASAMWLQTAFQVPKPQHATIHDCTNARRICDCTERPSGHHRIAARDGAWKPHRERRARGAARLDVHRSAVAGDDLVRDIETESESGIVALVPMLASTEWIEDIVAEFRGDWRSFVVNGERDVVGAGAHRYRDGRTCAAVGHGVANQIGQRLRDAPGSQHTEGSPSAVSWNSLSG